MTINITPGAIFWLVVGVFVYCEHRQFTKGYETFIWGYTKEESEHVERLSKTKGN